MTHQTYKGFAKVNVGLNAKNGLLVTASASATALSSESLENANKLAKKEAKKEAYKNLKRQIMFANQIIDYTCNNTSNNLINDIKCNHYIKFSTPEITPSINISYNPKQIRTAYNYPSSLPISLKTTRKPVITIVIAYHYANLQKDFNTFCQNNNLPSYTLQIEDLGKGNTNQTSINTGWAQEECLDVQWAYAMNPNAIIRVVAAKSSSPAHLFYAVQYASTSSTYGQVPDIISMSWGAPEFKGQNNYDSVFSNPNICYLAASGDSNYVGYPSSSPNVLSCGGTSLHLNNDNTRSRETTWPSAGCGASLYTSKPLYQKSINNITKYAKRCIPDIACVANPNTGVAVVYNSITYIFGGTSVSTPMFAGILSLGIQNRLNKNKQPITTVLTNTNQKNLLQNLLYTKIYNNGSNLTYTNNFYDVTSGQDGNYLGGSNFDVPTGLGVPKVSALIQSIGDY